NFGYEYTTHRLKDDDLEGLDLSSWRGAFNGAEAVSPETIELFCKRFEPFGFDRKAMMPVYGLAESSVGLVFPPLNRGIKIDTIERNTFTSTGKAIPINESETTALASSTTGAKAALPNFAKDALKFVSSGIPLVGHEIRVVDESRHELPQRQEGRLEFRGPSSTSGYYRDAQKTKALFDGEWLDSGDRAYIANGELYITGRIKDIIIRAGRNIYPDELEKMVGNIEGIRKGCVAVFASMDKTKQTEKLVVLAETKSEDANEHQELRKTINQLSIDLTGVPPDEIVLAPAGNVLKTSSGKIRRSASREHYEKGLVSDKPKSVAWQAIRLALSGVKPLLRRSKEYLGRVAFATYSWALFVLISPIAWLSMMLLPTLSLRWGMVQSSLKFLAFATATPIKVKGLENLLPQGTPSILVANHSSYLDSMALIATLPSHFRFIAKAELKEFFSTRIALKRINTEFVERFDMTQSLSDTQYLESLLKEGHSLILFPEGTLSRVPGLMPFKLGAFSMAANANVPIIPIAIRGTRSILRDRSWFPHHGSITIEIGKPIEPKEIEIKGNNPEWDKAIELRDRSRAFILKHCGEPDLG
ncbi:MAG: AMP-binding protein, partial [Campylobacterota bacterium]|nr:AMP-binding protein [Campylobacterota bacterium]